MLIYNVQNEQFHIYIGVTILYNSCNKTMHKIIADGYNSITRKQTIF